MVRETHHKSPALRGESRSRAWHDEIKNQFHGANTQDLFQIRRLRRSELPVNTVKLARFLIGKTLVHDSPKGRMSGRIVETEAYPIGDAAGHAFGGETPSRRSLFFEREARDRRGSSATCDRTPGRNRPDGAPSRNATFSGPYARSRPACESNG